MLPGPDMAAAEEITVKVNTMHPSMTGLLARQCESELRRSALRYVLHVPRRCRSVRHRAGWALVALGLTLAHRSGDA